MSKDNTHCNCGLGGYDCTYCRVGELQDAIEAVRVAWNQTSEKLSPLLHMAITNAIATKEDQ